MGSTYRQPNFPDPPENLPPGVREYLRQLVGELRKDKTNLVRALEDQEPVASLKVIYEEPARSRDGDEIEVGAGGWDPGSGAGKYVRRSGAWVRIG